MEKRGEFQFLCGGGGRLPRGKFGQLLLREAEPGHARLLARAHRHRRLPITNKSKNVSKNNGMRICESMFFPILLLAFLFFSLPILVNSEIGLRGAKSGILERGG